MSVTDAPSSRIRITLVDRKRFHGRRPRNRRQMRKRWRDPRNWRADLRPWEVSVSYGAIDPRTMQPWPSGEPKLPRLLEMHTLSWHRFKHANPAVAERCDVFVRVPMGTLSFRWYDEKQIWPQKDAGTYIKVFETNPLTPALASAKL